MNVSGGQRSETAVGVAACILVRLGVNEERVRNEVLKETDPR